VLMNTSELISEQKIFIVICSEFFCSALPTQTDSHQKSHMKKIYIYNISDSIFLYFYDLQSTFFIFMASVLIMPYNLTMIRILIFNTQRRF
jgi:hypothetical protein